MGGLLETLYILSGIVIFPLSQFQLKAKLMSILFRFKGHDLSLFLKTGSSKTNSVSVPVAPSPTSNMTEEIKQREETLKSIR